MAAICWASNAVAQPATVPMEAVFKNIQILRGVPSQQLLPIMNFMRVSLGVRCDYCHVAEDGKYQLDDRAPKRRAREMILMTRRLNESAFGGHAVVTCQTCHRGSARPVSVPVIGAASGNPFRSIPGEPPPTALPSAAELFARFEAMTRLESMPASRVTLAASHARIVEPGTPRARAIPRALSADGDVVIDGTRALARSPLSDGRFVVVGSDGRRAWTSGPSGVAVIPDADFTAFQRKLNPLLVLRLRAVDFTSARVDGIERIDDQETYAVAAEGPDGVAQRLWFSRETGALLRRTYYHPLALGLDPEQFDLSDYMDFGGYVLPATINTSSLDDEHLGVLKRVLRVEIGVRVTDADFEAPKRPGT